MNTVFLGFSYECSEFSQSWLYRWFMAKITDFGDEDEGFLVKITDFLAKITDFLAKITDFFISSMFTLHTNEGDACTKHVHTY